MSSKNDSNWYQNYEALNAYILERGHMPDNHVVENRALLSWALCGVQHNGRSITARKSKPVRSRPTRCSSLRSFWHCAAMNTPAAASRKPPHSAVQIAQRLLHSGVKMVEILGVLLYQKGDTAEPEEQYCHSAEPLKICNR